MTNKFVDDLAVYSAVSRKIRIRWIIAQLFTAAVQAAVAFFARGQRNVFLQYHRIDHERPPPDHWI